MEVKESRRSTIDGNAGDRRGCSWQLLHGAWCEVRGRGPRSPRRGRSLDDTKFTEASEFENLRSASRTRGASPKHLLDHHGVFHRCGIRHIFDVDFSLNMKDPYVRDDEDHGDRCLDSSQLLADSRVDPSQKPSALLLDGLRHRRGQLQKLV